MAMNPESLDPTAVGEADLAAIRALIAELRPQSPESVSLEELRAVAARGTILVIRDAAGAIVAMATLIVFPKLGHIIGRVEDVVVAAGWRGQGIGRRMMEELVGRARQAGVTRLDLTSNDSRAAAHALYRSLGFARIATNVFRLKL